MTAVYEQSEETKTVSTSSPVIEDDGRLCAVTVRFPHWVWETIRSIAADRSCSMAELVRQVVQYGLSDIDQHFLRDEQMAEIRSAVVQLMDVISQVERELHRIGINYNQEIRLRHILFLPHRFLRPPKADCGRQGLGIWREV